MLFYVYKFSSYLTNMMKNSKELFGDKQCYFEYKDECSDVIEKAKEILNDHDKVAEITKNAIDIVLERHTHEKRAIELYNILHSLVSGVEIPRIWGQ